MAKFIKGDVIVVPFPFSNLTQAKRRPALVIATLDGDDMVLCQITSQTIRDNYAVSLDDKDFETGGLKQTSNGGLTAYLQRIAISSSTKSALLTPLEHFCLKTPKKSVKNDT